MASPCSAIARFEDNDSDRHGPRAAKKRRRASTAGASRPSPREIGFMREPQKDGSASFLGSSSGIHFIRHVYNAFARRSADLQQIRARDRSSVPGEDDRLHRSSGTTRDADELWSRSELEYSPTTFSFEDLVHWTRRYFENWHPIFPCLHAPTVLKVMETLGHNGTDSVSRLDMVIIRAIISISLGDSRQVERPELKIGPVPATLVFQSVQHVMQDIQSLLVEPTTIQLIQAAFTAQLALTSLLRLNAASRIGGVITRTAFHLGLHRCPGRFSCFSSEEVNIRYRLFWSIYSLERYLSQALGIPLGIRDDDIDVCYPGGERHMTTSHTPDDQRLRLLSHLAKFARVRGLILELRNKSILHSHSGAVEASHVNGELSQWWNEVYEDVNPIEDESEPELEPGSTFRPYHRLLLTILKHEAIISMNRPLLAVEKPTPDYKNALQTCIGSSRSLLTALKKYLSASPDASLAWPSFTWTTWMACLILLYASWEGEFPARTALKYAKMGISVLENLALRGSTWPETCIEAIKSMESALSTNSSGNPQQEPASDREFVNRPHVGLSGEMGAAVNGVGPPSTPSRHRQSLGMNEPFSQSDHRAEWHRNRHSPVGTRQQDPSTSSVNCDVNTGENHESVFLSPPNISDTQAVFASNGGFSLNGQTSAGLIFGTAAHSNALLHSGFVSQDPLGFADSSLSMNDLWSVADGPWMIDGNLL
ncbi:transcriptional regulator family: Fungal Specific TF [Penicillium hispanicum]|uniref:transcriptional regulator family: Fungal Specific TF n=1 Tax=Penicillium hispanicum TaxID=1080232 RepID=UPI00253FA4BE|nr:transcriptional regulator family: Fungal Specific TF [Penicillium hispanicum]KAJ5584649.1 transcriptional regulator family: Fungal Specific TF [Penicillium hispanicum]